MSLVEFLQSLVDDPALLERFQNTPEVVMEEAGLSEGDAIGVGITSAPNNQFSVLEARDGSTNINVLRSDNVLLGTFQPGVQIAGYEARLYAFENDDESERPTLNIMHAVTQEEIQGVEIEKLELKILYKGVESKEGPSDPVDPQQTLQIQVGDEQFALVTKMEGIDDYSQWLNGLLGPKKGKGQNTHYKVTVGGGQVLYVYDIARNTYHGAETKKIVLRIPAPEDE